MFWLYNTEPIISFYQVFFSNNKVYSDDNNIIYNFDYLEDSEYFESNTKNIKNFNLKFKIKILDNLISYTNMTNNETFVFSNQMKFINPNDNDYAIPIFKHSYKKVNTNKMPNLIESNYNMLCELDFLIYDINKNIQIVVETNLLNNTVKKYFITNNLNLIKNFIKK
jgi:hypothetical protein